PADPADVAEVNALQDRLGLRSRASAAFVVPDYDGASLDATRAALLQLARGLVRFDHTFGDRAHVDPIRHLILTAAGWGGLPDAAATYRGVDPTLPADGSYRLTVRNVPVDAFWSISVYNRDGYFEPNDRNAYSVNNITAKPDPDGSVTIQFGGCSDDS